MKCEVIFFFCSPVIFFSLSDFFHFLNVEKFHVIGRNLVIASSSRSEIKSNKI